MSDFNDCSRDKDFNEATCKFIKKCPDNQIRNKNGRCVKGTMTNSERSSMKHRQKEAYEKCAEKNEFINCTPYKKCEAGTSRNLKTLKCVKDKIPINTRLNSLKGQINSMNPKNRGSILIQLSQMKKTSTNEKDKEKIEKLI